MKTPKRHYKTTFLEWDDEFQGRLSSNQQRAYARWKRKNRVKSLKNTIRTINNKLADANLSRIILRNYLINKRNAFIIRSRKAETEQARKDWLAATRDLSLFINLSYTPAELIEKLNGKDPIPHAIKFTAEERAILTSLREEE